MKQCERYSEIVRKECLFSSPLLPVSVTYGICNATRERDICNCGGDERRCDFSPAVRERAKQNTVGEPLACPCCGGDAEIKETVVYNEDGVFVRCKACGLRSKLVLIDHPYITKDGVDESTRYTSEKAKAKAVALWNNRKH